MNQNFKFLSDNERPIINNSRREFIRTILRCSTLGILGFVGINLTVRKGSSTAECINAPVCYDCKLFKSCTLPRARETRNSL
jgi:hypothetical protein